MSSPADERVTYFAQTTFRHQGKAFGIRQADRFAHMYLIGKTGTGKSTLLETLVRQDLHAGRGLALSFKPKRYRRAWRSPAVNLPRSSAWSGRHRRYPDRGAGEAQGR